MLALLMIRGIPADKVVEKAGTVTLRVEKDQFTKAVEVLRQNGYPKQKRLAMEDLFPSNQLVTSPTQERAKMMFLKEQQLESMIAAMDGVVAAKISIAQKTDENGKPTGQPSAAVFVKYSPDFNMKNYETQIKSLVRDSVPDVATSDITVVMQATDYRYLGEPPDAPAPWRGWLENNIRLAAGGAAAFLGLLCLGMFLLVFAWRHGRRAKE